ncbi:PTI1-like tyrosine-protein kinase At3g15890 [Vicia villosa]|uniref:PTI1-like tyrosine-protein kinase At3g15890 n=1 Tax=Vicia villosa TaxID=3911 RepID=UPI00273AEEC8|nr:PTI1-like tyrosine-protein kinase At3g15890 [Vicia villosa]
MAAKSSPPFSFRLPNIALGNSHGILYLHHQATPRIIHRGIEPSHVLLDSDFRAFISGFGFAMIIPDGETQVTKDFVKGTIGYLAPEFMLGKVNESCDVYSFGILLLELASGRKPILDTSSTMKNAIVDWALALVCEKKFSEIVDPKLKGNYVEEEFKRVIVVGLMCAQDLFEKRPTMIDVVELLKGEPKAKFSNKESSKMFRSYIL